MRPQTDTLLNEKKFIISGNTNHKCMETAQPQQAESHTPRKSYQDFISLLQRELFGPGSSQLKPLINEEWHGLKCSCTGSHRQLGLTTDSCWVASPVKRVWEHTCKASFGQPSRSAGSTSVDSTKSSEKKNCTLY